MFNLKNSIVLILLLLSGTLSSQVPDGGIRLNAESGSSYQQIGNCTATEITVSGQSFVEGLEVVVGSEIANSWDAQIKFPAIAGIETNDVVLVAFYARTISSIQETGEGQLNVCIEINATPYTKELYYNISIGQEWKQYYAPVVIKNTLASSAVNYAFHCGFPSQTFEIAEVQFLNYKQTLTYDELPQTEITYIGQAPDAAWRAPAADRIQQIRKGTVDIIVYDELGQLLENGDVTIEMIQHQFGFGTAIGASEFTSNATYRNKVLEIFNEVVFENDLKWPQFNPASENLHILNAMDTLDAHNIPIRGHNIIWPSFRNTPNIVEALKDDPAALRNTIDNHIDEVTQFTKGRLNDWDVMNEPYSEHDIQDILGDEVMADWYQRARYNDRDVKLYINDYSIISAGGKNIDHQDYYYDIIEFIENNGGPIDGIGLQGHMGSELTPITKVYDIVERFAALGKDIKITEHDVAIDQRTVQAEYTRDFMTILFSHSSVKSLLVWGFWEDKHWKPDGAFYNSDWSVRPHGEVWNDLIKNQWWTPATNLTTDAQGSTSLDGFLGTYKYTVNSGGTERTGTFVIDNSHESGIENRVVISLDETLPDNFIITSSITGYLCEGEETMLSVPEGSGLSYNWYKDGELLLDITSSLLTGQAGLYTAKVVKGAMEITSAPLEIIVNSTPEAAVISSTGDLSFCQGGSVLLSFDIVSPDLNYSWMNGDIQVVGKEASINATEDGVYTLLTRANGCSSLSNTIEVNVDPLPYAVISALGDTEFCVGESLYLSANSGAGIIYKWFKNDVDMGISGNLVEVVESGAYSLTTRIGTCSTNSETVNVFVTPVPGASITTTEDLTFCEGGRITLTANSGENLTYEWMNGVTVLAGADVSIDVSEGGNYTVTTTDIGCSMTSDPVIVTVLSATDPSCFNGIEEGVYASNVYPNPFKKSFEVDLNGQTGKSSVELYNASGEVVYNELLHSSEKLTIQVTNPGLYILLIRDERSLQTFKLTGE